MKLEGKAREQLYLALLSAFPTRASLTQMVAFGLNQNLPTIAEGTNLAEAVGQLVGWAEEQGHLAAVVSSASNANPTNPELQAVVNLCDWVKLDAWDPWVEPVACPYPGMRPFHANEMPYFYGRQVEVDTLLQRLRVQRLVMIIGPSGSGKSSLVAAGLLPQLATSSYWPAQHWLVRRMRPGATPIARLSEALQGKVGVAESEIDSLLARQALSQPLLLIVDQLEELFVQASLAEQRAFIATLQKLREIPHYTLLLLMRADFYPDLMTSILWPIAPNERMEIAPLRGEALRQAIVQPATDVGVTLEVDLVERLLADAADEPGTLPLLQETLVLLWNKMQRRRLTLVAYEQLGHAGRSGLMVALATRADAALAALPPAQQPLAQRLLLRLVQFGEGRPDTRRQQPVSALQAAHDDPALFDQTLQALATARLVTLSGSDAQETQVDLAHEALIRGWPQFQQWVQAQRVAELTRRRLVSQAAEWRRLGAGEGGLLDRRELPEAESWLASAAPIGVDADVLALIDRSRLAIEQAEAERIAAQRRAGKQAQVLAEEAQRLTIEEKNKAEKARQQVQSTLSYAETRVRSSEEGEQFERNHIRTIVSVGIMLIFVGRLLYSCFIEPARQVEQERKQQEGQYMLATIEAQSVQQGLRDMTTVVAKTPTALRATAIASSPTPEAISVDDFEALFPLTDLMVSLDIRTKASYEAEHIPGSLNIPAAEFDQRVTEVPADKLIVVYCDCLTDEESVQVARNLIVDYGLTAMVLKGGWSAWRTAQEPSQVSP